MKMIVLLVISCFALTVVLQAQTSGAPTVAEAQKFMDKAEARLAELSIKARSLAQIHAVETVADRAGAERSEAAQRNE
jgi:hypothetical protein